jgi:hypothetical protein
VTDKTRYQILKEGEAYLALHKARKLTARADLIRALGNKWYRLNALYKIKIKEGLVKTFKPNIQQRQRFVDRHNRDIILKARQLGFTTFEMIDALDDVLWTPNFSAGCIAHTLVDAQDIFRNKVKFAYDQLRQSAQWQAIFMEIGLRMPIPANDKGDSYVFDNGSSIRVSTSYRGGTLQRLHVSEFGKICKKYPEKAKEIVTGAFEAVGLGGQVTLESTAEGREGYFFTYCDDAKKMKEMGKAPSEMEWKFHFFPWYEEPSYRLDAAEVEIPSRLHEYFRQVKAKWGVDLTKEQQAWYAMKDKTLGDDMKREYPTTPEEAFEQNIEGAYYATEMTWLRENGRITPKVKYNPALPVITGWDLGMSDATSIVFAQIVGREVHVIDYYEASGYGLAHYAEKLSEKKYVYGAHYGPHDLAVRELGTGMSRFDTAATFGIKFELVPRISKLAEGIEAVRQFLPKCYFAEVKAPPVPGVGKIVTVDRLVDCLDSYRKEWDEKLGVFKDTPRHDWASHGVKGFETLARSGLFELNNSFAPNTKQQNTQRGRGRWGAHT